MASFSRLCLLTNLVLIDFSSYTNFKKLYTPFNIPYSKIKIVFQNFYCENTTIISRKSSILDFFLRKNFSLFMSAKFPKRKWKETILINNLLYSLQIST